MASVGRKRITDTHLPQRVYQRHGAYYFVDRDSKWHPLGKTLQEMYHGLAEFLGNGPIGSFNDLFDRYVVEVLPDKAPRTQRDNLYEFKLLRASLGRMDPRGFKPRHGYAYYNERKKTSLKRAHAELALLSHVFTKAVEWGVVDWNPCKEIRKERPKPRDRYVTDEEYQAAYAKMTEMLECAMDLAVLTGLRNADLLGLKRSNLSKEGIVVPTDKTTKPLLIEWSPKLRRVVTRTMQLEPQVRQPLICTRLGKHYTVDGFASVWRRKIDAAILDTDNPLTERFQFRDLRAKSASDDELEAASARLGHTSTAITERVYRRKPRRVTPLR